MKRKSGGKRKKKSGGKKRRNGRRNGDFYILKLRSLGSEDLFQS